MEENLREIDLFIIMTAVIVVWGYKIIDVMQTDSEVMHKIIFRNQLINQKNKGEEPQFNKSNHSKDNKTLPIKDRFSATVEIIKFLFGD